MTRHEDNLARLAKARAKLAGTTPGQWEASGVEVWYSEGIDLVVECAMEGYRFADARHIAAWHNAAGLVLDMCESALTRHGEFEGKWCACCDSTACPDYLHAEEVLKAVAGDD